jgi:hypothetical protein
MDQNKGMAVFSIDARKLLTTTIAAAAIACMAAPPRLAAASPDTTTTTTVIYKATGTFATPAVSGSDQLQLAGNPFTIFVFGNPSAKPSQTGANWAMFQPLTVTGTVYVGAVASNEPIGSKKASIELAKGASEDIVQLGFPFTPPLVGALMIRTKITLPAGTLSTVLIHPFASVSLDPTNATVTYANSTESTVLNVETGTLEAVPSTGTPTAAALMAPGRSAVILVGAQAVKPKGLITITQ